MLFSGCTEKEESALENSELSITESLNEELMEDDKDESGYDLNELINFFEGPEGYIPYEFSGVEEIMRYEDVIKEYPVEIDGPGYSRYEVKGGGYFYVFWTSKLLAVEEFNEKEVGVVFTSYLPSSKSIEDFANLEVRVSTAADVKAVDPAIEMIFVMSSGIASCSYLNEEEVLFINYSYSTELKIGEMGYEDFVIERMSVIPRCYAPTVYSRLETEDLP